MPTSADVLLTSDPATLRGRTVMISGATGAVGRALVSRLVELGAKPAIALRKPWQVAKLQEELGGAEALVGLVGARDSEAAAGFVKGATDSLGPIDAFLSTAGAFRMAEVGRDKTGDDLALLEANFLAVHNLVRAVVSPMKRRRTGSLVFVGADVVGAAPPGMALYAAAKALHEYAQVLAREVGPFGIRVAVVAAGVLDTEANRAAMPEADRSGWTPVERLVAALLGAAAGAAEPGADPLFRLAAG
jgi:NADP-dependent 3-hydroxy acid dehydrogenase YdfG